MYKQSDIVYEGTLDRSGRLLKVESVNDIDAPAHRRLSVKIFPIRYCMRAI
jgi:hypothetical protein